MGQEVDDCIAHGNRNGSTTQSPTTAHKGTHAISVTATLTVEQ